MKPYLKKERSLGLELLLSGKQSQGQVFSSISSTPSKKKKNQSITQTKNTLNAEVIKAEKGVNYHKILWNLT